MKDRFKKKKQKEKEIAAKHIKELFRQAELVSRKDMKLANRYVALARKISTRLKIRIPIELKRKFCKNCYTYLKPGLNARIRLNKGKKTYFCMSCGHYTRVPYKA